MNVTVHFIIFFLLTGVNTYEDDYSWDLAKDYLMYAYSAYCDATVVNTWTCFWCANTTEPLNYVTSYYDAGTNTFGYVGINSNEILLGFRGTIATSEKNWVSDLTSARLIPYKNITGVEVARGFFDAYMAIQPGIMNDVMKLVSNYPDFPIVITGHSLGGALSVMAALDIAEELNTNNIWVWNYGQPRVGNANFDTYFNSKISHMWRTVNQYDPVPHLPPTFLGFQHTTTEVWFPTNGTTYEICSSVNGEDLSCSDSIRVPYSVFDHLSYLGIDERIGDDNGC